MNDRLLTPGEAAELLGVGERMVRRLCHERRLRFVKVGKHLRVPESAVTEYRQRQTVEPVRQAR